MSSIRLFNLVNFPTEKFGGKRKNNKSTCRGSNILLYGTTVGANEFPSLARITPLRKSCSKSITLATAASSFRISISHLKIQIWKSIFGIFWSTIFHVSFSETRSEIPQNVKCLLSVGNGFNDMKTDPSNYYVRVIDAELSKNKLEKSMFSSRISAKTIK